MIKRIICWIRKLISNYYDSCYKEMEQEGHAAMNCCCGIVGGSYATDYLSETCIECPYLVLVTKNETTQKCEGCRFEHVTEDDAFICDCFHCSRAYSDCYEKEGVNSEQKRNHPIP